MRIVSQRRRLERGIELGEVMRPFHGKRKAGDHGRAPARVGRRVSARIPDARDWPIGHGEAGHGHQCRETQRETLL